MTGSANSDRRTDHSNAPVNAGIAVLVVSGWFLGLFVPSIFDPVAVAAWTISASFAVFTVVSDRRAEVVSS